MQRARGGATSPQAHESGDRRKKNEDEKRNASDTREKRKLDSPDAMGVYACGVYSANLSALFGENSPGSLAAPIPRSSKIFRVNVACGSGLAGFDCWKAHASHTTEVCVPGMTPSVGPTGYVMPLSQTAESVRCAGVL